MYKPPDYIPKLNKSKLHMYYLNYISKQCKQLEKDNSIKIKIYEKYQFL